MFVTIVILFPFPIYVHRKLKLLLTPFLQTAQGSMRESLSRSGLCPDTMSLVFFILTLRPFISLSSFHSFSFVMHSSKESAAIARSSAY